jgi:hypothetical protein
MISDKTLYYFVNILMGRSELSGQPSVRAASGCQHPKDVDVSAGILLVVPASVSQRILNVLGLSNVTEVFRTVVRRLVVNVTNYGSLWLNAYERLCNYLMDSSLFTFSIFPEGYERISLGIKSIFENVAYPSNSPLIGDIVNSLVIRDWFPDFGIRIGLRHDGLHSRLFCLESPGR